MAIVDLLAHWHRENEAEAPGEIFWIVAVEDDGVNKAHGFQSGVEIEADDEREPFAGFGFVDSFNFHDGANGAGLFERDLLYIAREVVEAKGAIRFELRAVFQRAR